MTTEQLSTLLKNKQTELCLRINAIEADFRKGRSADFSEQTTECENDEVLDEIHQEAKRELSLVTQAINRIERGNYGICQQCEQPISSKRLEALPYITTCIDCAK